MDLYSDTNKRTTLKGLGFKNKEIAKHSINKINLYFDNLYFNQKIPNYSSNKTLPKKYLSTKKEACMYYSTQKMYRVLALLNRAKSMLDRIENVNSIHNIEEAINVFEKWMSKYQNKIKGGKKIVSCCRHKKTDKKCRRLSDNKIFNLPRKFSKKKCKNPKGFTMRSSCAPYKNCYKV